MQAALLAPGLDLARGADLSRTTTELARAPGGHGRLQSSSTTTLSGTELYRAIEARALASAAPFLPGALMAPALVQLHGRMQYVGGTDAARKGGAAGKLLLRLKAGHV